MNIDIIDIDTVDATTVRIDGTEFAKADCAVSAYGTQHAQIVAGGTTFLVSHGSAVDGRRPVGQSALLFAINGLLSPAAAVTFSQSGTGAVSRTAQEKLRESVSVKDFGAVGDGTTDDTEAFRKAYQRLVAIRISSQSTVFDYTMPILRVPYGRYLITGSITEATSAANAASGLIVEGENAVLLGGAGVFNFFEVRSGFQISGVAFQGGGRGFYVQSGNTDSARFNVDRCTFQNQTVECFGTDDNSASSIINVTRSRIYLVNGGLADVPRIATLDCDFVNLSGCWIYYGGTGAAFYTDCDILNFRDNLCVPNYLLQANSQRCWFYNEGSLNLEGNRFGAEAGGCTVVENQGDYSAGTVETHVRAHGNAISSANQPAFKFYALPTSIDISENSGFDGTPGVVWFDDGIAASEVDGALRRGRFRIQDMSSGSSAVRGNVTVKQLMGGQEVVSFNKPALADLLISANTDLSGSNRISTSSGAASYTMDGGRTGRRFTGPAATSISFEIASGGLTTINAAVAEGGWFTVVYLVRVLSAAPMYGYARMGSRRIPVKVNSGDNILSFQVCRVAGLTANAKVEFTLEATDDIVIGPLRVFANACQVTDKRLVLAGTSAAPTSGQFFVGDVVEYTPTASGSMGVVCTTAGSPGTWKTFGAIAA